MAEKVYKFEMNTEVIDNAIPAVIYTNDELYGTATFRDTNTISYTDEEEGLIELRDYIRGIVGDKFFDIPFIQMSSATIDKYNGGLKTIFGKESDYTIEYQGSILKGLILTHNDTIIARAEGRNPRYFYGVVTTGSSAATIMSGLSSTDFYSWQKTTPFALICRDRAYRDITTSNTVAIELYVTPSSIINNKHIDTTGLVNIDRKRISVVIGQNKNAKTFSTTIEFFVDNIPWDPDYISTWNGIEVEEVGVKECNITASTPRAVYNLGEDINFNLTIEKINVGRYAQVVEFDSTVLIPDFYELDWRLVDDNHLGRVSPSDETTYQTIINFKFKETAHKGQSTSIKYLVGAADVGDPEPEPVIVGISYQVKDPYAGHETDGHKGGNGDWTNYDDRDGATPNSSISHILSSGLNGTWVFSETEMTTKVRNVSKTINLLYKKASENLLGLLASVYTRYAENIEKNMANVLMLPITKDKLVAANMISTDTDMAIGGSGIWNGTSSWSDYVRGNNSPYTIANFLTGPIYTYNVELPVIHKYYDNFLDFSPYTNINMYVPYIGTVQIPTNYIYDKQLILSFRINIRTGDIVAILFDELNDAYHQICVWNGSCGYQFSMSYNDTSTVVAQAFGDIKPSLNALISGVAGVAGGVIGGVTAGPAGATTGSNIAQNVTKGLQIGNTTVPEGGKLGGNASGIDGWLAGQKIYITIERPVMSIPKDYNVLTGYRTKQTHKMADLTGYQVIDDAHITNSATNDEKEMLITLLKSGVIF